MTKEIWKDIVNYEGVYAVSNFGRIKRIAPGPSTRVGYILSTPPGTDGYAIVGLSKNGKRKIVRVHRVVARAFLGEPPLEKPEVNHKDGDKLNNCVSNLEYTDRSGNCSHAYQSLDRERFLGEDSPFSYLLEDEVRAIRSLAKKGVSHREIAKRYKTTKSNVEHIVKRRSWTHI